MHFAAKFNYNDQRIRGYQAKAAQRPAGNIGEYNKRANWARDLACKVLADVLDNTGNTTGATAKRQ